jgi:hypothetical protein
MGKATESIYDGKSCVVPLAEVQHIQKLKRGPYAGETGLQPGGLHVITRMTTCNHELNEWENPIYIPQDEASSFLSAWCRYRSEIESESLRSLEPCAECNGVGKLDGDVMAFDGGLIHEAGSWSDERTHQCFECGLFWTNKNAADDCCCE